MTELEALKKRVAHHYKEAMEAATIACAYAEESEKLRAFANAVMGEWPDFGTMDGGDIQEIAVRHGILVATTPAGPCGDGCQCADAYTQQDFEDGQAVCYRKTPLLTGSNARLTGSQRPAQE